MFKISRSQDEVQYMYNMTRNSTWLLDLKWSFNFTVIDGNEIIALCRFLQQLIIDHSNLFLLNIRTCETDR